MKVIPIADNHIILELGNGYLVDINDGYSRSSDKLYITPSNRNLGNIHNHIFLATVEPGKVSIEVHK